MKQIYILQMHTGTAFSRLIRLITRYRYSHVLISMDDSFERMYSFGRKRPFNPFYAGFVIESIDGKFFNYFNKTSCRIYKLNISNKKYDKLNSILKSFEDNKDYYRYDIAGLIFKFISIPVNRKKHYVCSEFVAEVLKKAEIYDFSKPTCLVRPKDFENILNAKIIYTGLLKDKKSLI